MVDFEKLLEDMVKEAVYEGVDPETVNEETLPKEQSEEDSKAPDLHPGDIFNGSFFTGKKKDFKRSGTFTVKSIEPSKRGNSNYKVVLVDNKNQHYTTQRHSIQMDKTPQEMKAEQLRLAEEKLKEEERIRKEQQALLEYEKGKLRGREYSEQLETLVLAGIKNIWMVGPAGCGKTTMAHNLAEKLGYGFHSISCGIGTSAAEFIGYKYPQREATDFAIYYAKPSVILIDEFTALDASVAQICNAALANGYINTTTGKVHRHPECIIIATSNTFGQGANRQYIANNQIDASTIDRFVGGMMEVDYSVSYESNFVPDVVNYVWKLREVIKGNGLRRVASTRMIIEGEKLLKAGITDWKDVLTSNWTESERTLLSSSLSAVEKFSRN